MRPAPIPNEDETDSREDELVADPLADETLDLFDSTAKKNRAIFTEIFRPVPTNLVRDWKAYELRYFPLIFKLIITGMDFTLILKIELSS